MPQLEPQHQPAERLPHAYRPLFVREAPQDAASGAAQVVPLDPRFRAAPHAPQLAPRRAGAFQGILRGMGRGAVGALFSGGRIQRPQPVAERREHSEEDKEVDVPRHQAADLQPSAPITFRRKAEIPDHEIYKMFGDENYRGDEQ